MDCRKFVLLLVMLLGGCKSTSKSCSVYIEKDWPISGDPNPVRSRVSVTFSDDGGAIWTSAKHPLE
jgi:hypothetical protein